MVHKKYQSVKKSAHSLFVLLTVFSIIAITPSAFADHSKVDINMAAGSSVLGCEEMNMCYMPYNAALDLVVRQCGIILIPQLIL